MKYLVLILLLAGSWSGTKATTSQSSRCDADCTNVVRRLLQESRLRISTGYGAKQSYRLGDKVAVALQKIYSDENIAKSKNIKIFLPVIRAAFLHPEVISNPEDIDPKVTLRLLRDLKDRTKDPALKSQISEAIGWLLEHSKTTP